MLVSCRLGGQSGGTTPPRLHKAEDGCRQLLSGLAHEACSVQAHLDTLQVPRLPAPVSVLRAPHNVASWQPRRHQSEVHQLHGRLRHLERQQQEAQAVLHSLLGDVAQGDVVVKGGRGLFPPVLGPSLDSAYSDSSRPVSSPRVRWSSACMPRVCAASGQAPSRGSRAAGTAACELCTIASKPPIPSAAQRID